MSGILTQLAFAAAVISLTWREGSPIPLIPNLGLDEPYMAFCKNNTYYLFTTRACPGGVRFLKSSPGNITGYDPEGYAWKYRQEICTCTNTPYIILNNADDYEQTTNLGPDKTCLYSIVESFSNHILSKDNGYGIVGMFPMTETTAKEELFVTRGTDYPVTIPFKYLRRERMDVSKLRLRNQTAEPELECGSFIFWSNPSGLERECLLLRSNYISYPNSYGVIELPREESRGRLYIGKSTCDFDSEGHHYWFGDITLSRSCSWIEENIKKSEIVAHIKFINSEHTSESDLLNGQTPCNLPVTCAATPESIQMDPPSKLTNLSPREISENLVKEARHLTEYRLRITKQNARIRKPPTYPPFLTIIELCTQIFRKLAANVNFSSPEFIDVVFKLFEYLYFDQDKKDRLTERQYNGIIYGLQKCNNFLTTIPSSSFICPRPNRNTSDLMPLKTVPADRLYDATKHDMLVEYIWKAVDVTHMACSSYYSFNPVFHHYYGKEAIRFFSLTPVQYRWFRSISAKQQKAFSGILPGLNVDTLKQADEVVAIVLNQNNVYHNPLRKPFRDVTKRDGKETDCPADRVIWGGEACCLTFSTKDGFIPPYPEDYLLPVTN